jgi:hypothetical protein
MKKIGYTFATLVLAGGAALAGAAPAAAAHCVDEERTTPGYSYFGNDHAAGDREAQGSKEGPHAGTSGASDCNAVTDADGNPSDRAPGKNR